MEQWTDEKVTCPQKYLSKGSKSPSPGSEISPCKYSARGAKSQQRFSHSADQGKITKQLLPQGKFVVIKKVKSRHNECKKKTISPFRRGRRTTAKKRWRRPKKRYRATMNSTEGKDNGRI